MAPLRPRVRHSSRLVASDVAGMRRLCLAAQKTHDPWLMRYFILAASEWLPTEHRLLRSRTAGTLRDGTCNLCESGHAETVRHTVVCEGVRAQVLRAARVVVGVLREVTITYAPGKPLQLALTAVS